jgi:hypothetical protein
MSLRLLQNASPLLWRRIGWWMCYRHFHHLLHLQRIQGMLRGLILDYCHQIRCVLRPQCACRLSHVKFSTGRWGGITC